MSLRSRKRFIKGVSADIPDVVVIGGGALLDLAGYAAATAHRGVRLIRVPTTVLAQNDLRRWC